MNKNRALPNTQRSRVGVYGVIVREEAVLFITQREGIYRGLFDLPGGGMEFGETPEETLRREILEELDAGFSTMHLFDNITTVEEVSSTPDRAPFTFHRIGLIYRLEGLHFFRQANKPTLLKAEWLSIRHQNPDSLSPLGKQILLRFRDKELHGE